MTQIRTIRKVLKSKAVMEGAGVHLKRGFGFDEVPEFDPFLLFDDFRSDSPDQYLKGFPWHPHRGIETITYVLAGDVEHGDSLGNKGIIGAGDVQWMTAGSGIIHQEMPLGDEDGRMYGFQLWANLPANSKMIAPRYRGIQQEDIPELILPEGIIIKIIAGEVAGINGPLQGIAIEPEYIDVYLPAETSFTHPTRKGFTVFAYIFEGEAGFSNDGNEEAESDTQGNGSVVLFNDGDFISIATKRESVRFLLVSGKPLDEPVAWQGPVVMNTDEELELAFKEYKNGTFIKNK